LISYDIYIKYKIYENTEIYEKYLLYIPDIINNKNILLLPLIRDNYIIINNSYNNYIDKIIINDNSLIYKNKICNKTFYNTSELNKKIELYNNYISINNKIDDMYLYYNSIDINIKNILINL